MIRAAFLHKLYMDAEQFLAQIRAEWSRRVRQYKAEIWKMQSGELLQTGNK